jgi:hypothetical protein
MRTIIQRLNGTLFTREGKGAILLDETSEAEVVVRYALVFRGTEHEFFPGSLLDDWGNEIKGAKLYEWVREEGAAFPRAEIFGRNRLGEPDQCFVRDLELYLPYPVYGYVVKGTPVHEGIPINRILVPMPRLEKPTRTTAPRRTKSPLKYANVTWWEVTAERLGEFGYMPA